MTQLVISLTPEAAARLRAEADARGTTAESVAAEAVEAWFSADALDWEEDLRRLEEPGENVPLDEAFDRFDAKVAAARSKGK